MWAVPFSSWSLLLFLSVRLRFIGFFPLALSCGRDSVSHQGLWSDHNKGIAWRYWGNLAARRGTVIDPVSYGESSSSRTYECKVSRFFQIWCFFECRLSKPHWVLTTHSSQWWASLSGSSSSVRCFPTPPQLNDASRPHQVKLLLITTLPGALSYFGRPVWKPFFTEVSHSSKMSSSPGWRS